jgi:hypothetical protein
MATIEAIIAERKVFPFICARLCILRVYVCARSTSFDTVQVYVYFICPVYGEIQFVVLQHGRKRQA